MFSPSLYFSFLVKQVLDPGDQLLEPVLGVLDRRLSGFGVGPVLGLIHQIPGRVFNVIDRVSHVINVGLGTRDRRIPEGNQGVDDRRLGARTGLGGNPLVLQGLG